LVTVDREAPVKLARVRLTNRSDRRRELALCAHTQLVLGATPRHARRVITEHDRERGALLARNPASGPWRDALAFARVVTPPAATVLWTTDRAAFIGRHGDPSRPRALGAPAAFDGATGPMLDPCFAWRVRFALEPGETREVTFVLGEGESAAECRSLLE